MCFYTMGRNSLPRKVTQIFLKVVNFVLKIECKKPSQMSIDSHALCSLEQNRLLFA
jgi:hypothetical protein